MAIPSEKQDRAIYHAILAEMHRLQSVLLSLQTHDDPDTVAAMREHFGLQQSVTLGKLSEWRQRRPDIYREAEADFKGQVAQS
jgi:hypothetical protein